MSTPRSIEEDVPLRDRIRDHPRPALLWLAGLAVLIAAGFGAFWEGVMDLPWDIVVGVLPSAIDPVLAPLATVGTALADLPTLLSRDLIPNQGYQLPDGSWEGAFLGLSAGAAWAVRVAVVYLYAFAWLGWLWRGYETFRTHYRYADWTPRDDMIDRMRGHRWGQFGLVVVFMFLVLALFAPVLGPVTVEENIKDPYSYEIEYYDDTAESVQSIPVGNANLQSGSEGQGGQNVGPLEYDEFDRFHPFGTLSSGKDLFTFMAAGARVSLFIGLVSMGIAGTIATSLALATAYYKGLVDFVTVIASDSIMSLPLFMVLILLSVVFQGTWIADIYNGAFLIALIIGMVNWPHLWRAVRGPAFQVAEQEWIDAARSFGQRPRITMQKHMAPYIIGYLLVYMSMSLGGVIISVAGLSFLGLGITAPTPEWGRAIDAGQQFVTTPSWHISVIPGLLIVLVVTAFNALGDGIRDAIDPQSETGGEGEAEGAEVAAGGGGA